MDTFFQNIYLQKNRIYLSDKLSKINFNSFNQFILIMLDQASYTNLKMVTRSVYKMMLSLRYANYNLVFTLNMA